MAWAAKTLLAIAALIGSGFPVVAQQFPTGVAQNPPPLPKNTSEGSNLPVSRAGLIDFFTARTPYEFWLTCLITLFGVVVILLFLVNVRRIENRRTEDVARPVIVVTLIVGGLILVTAGYSNEQIAPAFGLLGTIAGYILGRMSRPEADRAPPATNPEEVAATEPTPPGAA